MKMPMKTEWLFSSRYALSRRESKKAKTTKRSENMKNRNVSYRRIIPGLLIALGLSCLAFPAAAQTGNPSIVGLWRVHYFAGTVEIFQSFDQWHSDGQEFEVADLGPGTMCQGVFRQKADGTVKLFHTGWNFDQNGNLTGYSTRRR
jgi:hypothetical protein